MMCSSPEQVKEVELQRLTTYKASEDPELLPSPPPPFVALVAEARPTGLKAIHFATIAVVAACKTPSCALNHKAAIHCVLKTDLPG